MRLKFCLKWVLNLLSQSPPALVAQVVGKPAIVLPKRIPSQHQPPLQPCLRGAWVLMEGATTLASRHKELLSLSESM